MSYNSTSYKLPTKELRLEDMRKRAKKRGGKCLSKIYINGSSKFTWQCKRGHIWDATPQSIKQGSWCPKCVGRNHDIPFMQKLAKKRGGLCLSKKFIAVTKKLIWQCDKGHKWKAIPAAIKIGTWCPKCASNKHTMEYIQSYAAKYKGICISKKYVGNRYILKWECKKGHPFSASIENLQRRQSFCLQCCDHKKIIKNKKTTA